MTPAPPAGTERALGALVADRALRDALLGDLAEEYAERWARHGAASARAWYRGQAARSAPHLVWACWWPRPAARGRRAAALLAGVAGGYLTFLLLHQAAQLAAGLLLAAAGGAAGWAFAACSLAAGAGCAVLAGGVAARALPDAPLAGALTLAVVCGALAVAGMAVNGGVAPLWYWGGLHLLLLPVGACVGGVARARRTARRGAP
jgi:hypothetical protein